MQMFKGIGVVLIPILAFQMVQAVTVELPENPTRSEKFFGMRLTNAIEHRIFPILDAMRHCDDCEPMERLPTVFYFKSWLTNSITKVIIERTDPESMTEHRYGGQLVRESLPVA